MLFIVSSNIEKADASTRKQIRSHVMQGKRLKKDRSRDVSQLKSRQEIAKPVHQAPVKREEFLEICMAVVPSRVGSDFSFLELADVVEPSVVSDIVKGSLPCQAQGGVD